MKNRTKLIQNIVAIAVMVAGVGTMFTGLMIESMVILAMSGIISAMLILKTQRGRRSVLSYISIAMWVYVVGSFFVGGFSGFEGSLERFLDWFLAGIVIGIVAILLTAVQLFRINR